MVFLQDMHNDIQDVLGQSYGVPDDLDEDDLLGELDALEYEMAQETEQASATGVPSYLQVRTFFAWHRSMPMDIRALGQILTPTSTCAQLV